MDFNDYNKYIKYKNKYLQLKNQSGGKCCCYDLSNYKIHNFLPGSSRPNKTGQECTSAKDFSCKIQDKCDKYDYTNTLMYCKSKPKPKSSKSPEMSNISDISGTFESKTRILSDVQYEQCKKDGGVIEKPLNPYSHNIHMRYFSPATIAPISEPNKEIPKNISYPANCCVPQDNDFSLSNSVIMNHSEAQGCIDEFNGTPTNNNCRGGISNPVYTESLLDHNETHKNMFYGKNCCCNSILKPPCKVCRGTPGLTTQADRDNKKITDYPGIKECYANNCTISNSCTK